MNALKPILIWGAVCIALFVPLLLAVNSPLLQWREPVYIAAGFAGIIAMGILLLQPMLAGNLLPGLTMRQSRKVHPWLGLVLILAVLIHVSGLWITSPPDVVDALLFRSPTPFSVWGVIAMWALFLAGLIAALRKRLRLRTHPWRLLHTALAIIVVTGSVIHALLIEGTMEVGSKVALCGLVLVAMPAATYKRRAWMAFKQAKN